jgi:hypothetical protein
VTLGNQWKDLGFKESDIVSVYTDEQAVEDGVLVRSEGVLPCPFNRVTRAVWDAFTQAIGNKAMKVTNTTRLSQLGEAVNRKYKTGELTEGWVVLEFEGCTIWAMPNETVFSSIRPVQGWTIMFPGDY